VDVIDFVENGVLAESSHRLTPVQRFVLKMSYGLPLDADTKTIFANQTVMTEAEYVAFLHDEGRCNVAEGGHQFAQVAVAKGRRSGGTFLTAAMMACEVYDLLSSHECPQAHFGMSDTSVIGVMGVSHDKNQASALGEEAARNIARVPWFHRHAAKVSSTGRTFQTSHDIKTTGTWAADSDAVATVSLLFRSANVKFLKGHACKTVFLDEMAFCGPLRHAVEHQRQAGPVLQDLQVRRRGSGRDADSSDSHLGVQPSGGPRPLGAVPSGVRRGQVPS
jgi:hypothetical protein